jgi:hydrogenase-4 component F
MILLLMIFPLFLCGLILCTKKHCRLHLGCIILYAVTHLAVSLRLITVSETLAPYFAVDRLNSLFLIITAIILLGVSIYNIDFFLYKTESTNIERNWKYHIFTLLFIDAVNGVLLSTHIGVLWVFLEAATLFSAMLIYYYQDRDALEATWKYIFICSIGISLAFIGIIFLSIGCINGEISLFWAALSGNALLISPLWLKIALPFLLFGFGTKMGLAPMHQWLPDAYSEAPAPAAALISGTLSSCAFLAVLRVYDIILHAKLEKYSTTLLLAMGFFSLLVPAVFIGRAQKYRRMLAYSSVENMGIAAIGLGLGGIGIVAALIQVLGNSLIKSAFFMTAGNIFQIYKNKRINAVQNLCTVSPGNSWLMLACLGGICAFPPSVLFISELLIINQLLQYSIMLTIIFCLLLTIIIYGLTKNIFSMIFSGSTTEKKTVVQCSFWAYFPQWMFLALSAALGIFMPDKLLDIFESAAFFLSGGK